MTIRTPVVADVMTRRSVVLAIDASLEDADLALRSAPIMGLPVVDGDGALVGVVTNADLVAYRFAHLRPSVETTPTSSASENK